MKTDASKNKFLILRATTEDRERIAKMMADDYIQHYATWIKRLIRKEYDKRYRQEQLPQ